ncbi:uncharacterized protein F4812DRAFT_444783 [Daldinia caldariorum]|uniref:uncharacterized protein n=1 Tax=Daldinia caldariorum TaxID=326644 RepID=UPI002008495D|nr:uncharacterized protein F4812DRAFT_444783 [Daldinia caldariorum]KAI1463865.1 hypothetical protein F4812DRAFT_444783 [Daldinia caldariorum]
MANEPRSYLCGLFCSRPRRAARPTGENGLQGVEFSPRSSIASSVAPVAVASSSSTQPHRPAAALNNPELAGYYSPPASQVMSLPNPAQELRGYYAPEPAPIPRPRVHPTKVAYS